MEFEEAEAALTEANFLNNFCPVTWGYLALVNIQLGRYDTFCQCYLEAKKVNKLLLLLLLIFKAVTGKSYRNFNFRKTYKMNI